MSTKYGDRIDADKWAPDGADGQLQITAHARQRWRDPDRFPDGKPTLDEALRAAIPVHEGVKPAFQTGDHDEPEDILLTRVHGTERVADAILVVCNDWEPPGVATCFPVASKYDGSLRRYCRARLDCYPEQPGEGDDE
jgi:hypothetical protein